MQVLVLTKKTNIPQRNFENPVAATSSRMQSGNKTGNINILLFRLFSGYRGDSISIEREFLARSVQALGQVKYVQSKENRMTVPVAFIDRQRIILCLQKHRASRKTEFQCSGL
jgi:hypothetical protein